MILTVLLVLIFVGALIFFVATIHRLLVNIGGDGNSFLAKLRLGLRAIETETCYRNSALLFVVNWLLQHIPIRKVRGCFGSTILYGWHTS